MQNNILIVGFGSIGSRHVKILSNKISNKNLFILTKKKIKKFNTINNLKEAIDINPKFIIISNPTNVHLEYLKFFEKNFKNKYILVEKPLFNKFTKAKFVNNKILVAYNLRQHSIVNYLKDKISNKNLFNITIKCKSYLPNWRKGNYEKYYSSNKHLGGGVLLDLSHEFDYLSYIFGKFRITHSVIKKISKLKIDCEDYAYIYGKLVNGIFFSIELNYFSRFSERNIILDYKDYSIDADLIKNKISYSGLKNKIINFPINEIDNTYTRQIHKFLNKEFNNFCSYESGLNINLIIDKIKKL